MWHTIKTLDDIKHLEDCFDGFHDSCIKELKYISGAYVLEDLSMHPINDKRILNIVFQRQATNPTSIEMEFIGLLHLDLHPTVELFTCEILAATLEITNQGIIWYDCEPLSNNRLQEYRGTKILSSAVNWRIVDECTGKK